MSVRRLLTALLAVGAFSASCGGDEAEVSGGTRILPAFLFALATLVGSR